MKFKSFLAAHKTLIKDVAVSTCLLGASAGIVFGVSAGMFSINYMKLSGAEERLNAYKAHNYASEKISSAWNMNPVMDGETVKLQGYEAPIWQDMKKAFEENNDAVTWWSNLHNGCTEHLWDKYDALGMDKDEGEEISAAQQEERYKYSSMVIDGATHSTMDRSFNQGLYEGLVDFNHNAKLSSYDPENGGASKNSANSYKPSQDNTTDFINTYNAVIKEHDVVGLAGFNHSTPLTTMMTHTGDEAIAKNSDPEVDKELNSTGLILLDSNIANNQNIASVQFRADQPGFLTAIAVGQYFYNNLNLYHDKFQDLAVAAIGGVAIPTVTIYMGGFQRGVEFFNYCVLTDSILYGFDYWTSDKDPIDDISEAHLKTLANLIEHSKYKDEITAMKGQPAENILEEYGQKLYDEFEIKMIKLGDFDAHFSGTFAAGDAVGITKQYLNRGAQAIIVVAGPQSLDSAQEIMNQNSKCIVVGVDSAMEDGDYQRFHKGCSEKNKLEVNLDDPYVDSTVDADGNHSQQANSIIKFSAIKDIKSVSKKITRLCAEGKNWDVNTSPWNHNYTVEWDDQYRLNPTNCKYVIENNKCTISLTNEWQGKQLIIPQYFTINGVDYEVAKIAEDGFRNKIDNVEAIKFENPNGISLNFRSLGMGSNSKINFVEFPRFDRKAAGYFVTYTNNSFENWPTNNEGKIFFDSHIYSSQKALTYMAMTVGGVKSEWGMCAPDPDKSVCGPGFQTCGNIQNGLISISYDGFIPFMQAMKCVPFYDNDGNVVPLSEAWANAAHAYINECIIKGINLDVKYEVMSRDISSLLTFARTDDNGEPTIQYANYNHTMAILGILLDQAKIDFTSDMTLIPDGEGGMTTLPEGESIKMSVIDWLDYNMYMMA